MIKVGQKIEIKIEKIITGGAGIGKCGNIVVMVPYSVPGDKLQVSITETKKNYARAKIISIISPSAHRISPPCPYHFSSHPKGCGYTHRLYCGGCNLQMTDYKNQLELKTAIVQDFFDIKVNKIIPAANPFRYRNKVQMPVGGKTGNVITGFFHPQSHRIVNIEKCLLQSEKANEIILALRNLINEYKIQPYNEDKRAGILRHIILRQSFAFGKFMIIFVSKTNFIPYMREIVEKITKKFQEVVSVYQNINYEKTNVILGNKNFKLFGPDTIKEKIGRIIFEISPPSFFQINTIQTGKLYEVIKNFCQLKGDENIVDVYSGAGGISIYFAPFCRKITGIEEMSSSVSDAIKNAKINNTKNIFFIRGNADYILRKMDFSKASDIVILDPPRAGCSQIVLNSLLKILPQKIIYTSCNPATLSRDIKILSPKYKLIEIQPVDMFPQTAHIECVAKLSLGNTLR
ncbi:MAG: 23S rRNA (uracil(1939)-C(5))-methyltransferase RlmD [Elusimicrobia bacterium CG06_land_8_20_14_3_00_38_11]|nr:MAG: 23S rRNA (uracil(1939)-C(5))-methyltransferase RlmD [Elusimicrobia bacterium CG06_land_8_20_14_3_00_38_11]